MIHFFAKRFRDLQEVRRDERGFTLIELLVVVIIIGILAAIAIPTFLSQRDQADDATAKSDLRNMAAAAQAYAADKEGKYTNMTIKKLKDNYNFNQSASTENASVTVKDVDGSTDAGFTATIDSAAGNTFTFDSETGTVSG